MQLLLTGGRQRRTLIEQVDDEHRFEKAVALSLDTETGLNLEPHGIDTLFGIHVLPQVCHNWWA
jgi:hypothetical protein